MFKINLGSHNKRIGKDYINVDALDLEQVDVLCDFSQTPWRFEYKNNPEKSGVVKENSIDEIYFEEALEHISFHRTIATLKECYRTLKIGGKLYIQVPDAGQAMEYYVRGEICDCVPHKAHMTQGFKPNPSCPKCKGKGKIAPTRWLYTFLGQQKHEYDAHLNIFTKDILERDLRLAGFENIKFEYHPYKLRVNCYK